MSQGERKNLKVKLTVQAGKKVGREHRIALGETWFLGRSRNVSR